MTDERDLRNFEPAAPLPEGARGRSRVEAGLPPASPARPADDRMAVLPQWAIAEFERLRKERDEARSECDRARDSACLYEQIIERLQPVIPIAGPMIPESWAWSDMDKFGAYVVSNR